MQRQMVSRLEKLEPIEAHLGRVISITVRASHKEEDTRRCYDYIAGYAPPVDEGRELVVMITVLDDLPGSGPASSEVVRVNQPQPPEGWTTMRGEARDAA